MEEVLRNTHSRTHMHMSKDTCMMCVSSYSRTQKTGTENPMDIQTGTTERQTDRGAGTYKQPMNTHTHTHMHGNRGRHTHTHTHTCMETEVATQRTHPATVNRTKKKSGNKQATPKKDLHQKAPHSPHLLRRPLWQCCVRVCACVCVFVSLSHRQTLELHAQWEGASRRRGIHM